jgi:hypothetical protein
MQAVLNRTGDNVPVRLNGHEVAKAYYGIVKETIQPGESREDRSEAFARAALEVETLLNEIALLTGWTISTFRTGCASKLKTCYLTGKNRKGLS